MSKLAEYLNRHIVGNVFERSDILEQYATDHSPLKIIPKLVALPENPDDVRRLLRFVQQLSLKGYQLPVTPRGTGLDQTGAAIGPGLLLSTERLNRIEELDARGRLVRVQPGVTLEKLNAALTLHDLWLPLAADPRSTIGGLISNCPRDDYAGRYGGIYPYVERVELALASGDSVELAAYSEHQIAKKTAPAEASLYRHITKLLDDEADIILDRSMQPHDLLGYANVTRVREGRNLNLLPLLFGAQGTLGVITDIILRVEPVPAQHRRLLVSIHDQKAAERFLDLATSLNPYLLKLCDLRIFESAAALGKKSNLFTRKLGRGLLILVGFDQGRFRNRRCIEACEAALPKGVLRVEEVPDNTADFRELDSILSAYLNSDPGHPPVLDQVFIPAPELSHFLDGLKVLEQNLGLELPVFGSFVTSSYTVRPGLADHRRLLEFIKLYSELVAGCQGSITGHLPEGRLKTLITDRSLGVGERQVYTAVKTAFDPQSILNPGVKLGADSRAVLKAFNPHPLSGIIS